MSCVTVHVYHKNPGWAVGLEREGVDRSCHLTKEEAVSAGCTLAQTMHAEFVVYEADGSVGERKSYGVTLL